MFDFSVLMFMWERDEVSITIPLYEGPHHPGIFLIALVVTL